MPSRKRTKGKGRRKKAEPEPENFAGRSSDIFKRTGGAWQESENPILDQEMCQRLNSISIKDMKKRDRIISGLSSNLSKCNHGSPIRNRFIIFFEASLGAGFQDGPARVSNVFYMTARTLHDLGFEVMCEDEAYKADVIASLVSLGTDCVLKGQTRIFGQDRYYSMAAVTAMAILALEDGINFLSFGHKSVSKTGYLLADAGPETTRFFAKRVDCSCLKEIYNQLKATQPKLGVCNHCRQMTERSKLKRCNSCKLAEYCSKECQIADWGAGHKQECK